MAKHIERVENLNQERFLQEYCNPSRPVLVSDLTLDWAAMNRWSPDFLRAKFGDVPIIAYRSHDTNDSKKFQFSEYLEYMDGNTDADPYYLTNWHFRKLDPGLCADYKVPDYFENWLHRLPEDARRVLSWLYIGPAGSSSVMHLDTMMTSAWNVVISGRKRWLFYPPDQGENLYFGDVDAFNPDLEKFPLFARVSEPLECVQEPGEVVFTPSGWWHQVYNELPGIALTENFVNESNLDIARHELLSQFPEFLLKFYLPELFILHD